MSNHNHQCMGARDLQFIKDHNVPLNYDNLVADRDSMDPMKCLAHRTIQEGLRDRYGYYSDQVAWDANNGVVHTFIMNGYLMNGVNPFIGYQ